MNTPHMSTGNGDGDCEVTVTVTVTVIFPLAESAGIEGRSMELSLGYRVGS